MISVQATCQTCGTIPLTPQAIRIHADHHTITFECPFCNSLNMKTHIPELSVNLMVAGGAQVSTDTGR